MTAKFDFDLWGLGLLLMLLWLIIVAVVLFLLWKCCARGRPKKVAPRLLDSNAAEEAAAARQREAEEAAAAARKRGKEAEDKARAQAAAAAAKAKAKADEESSKAEKAAAAAAAAAAKAAAKEEERLANASAAERKAAAEKKRKAEEAAAAARQKADEEAAAAKKRAEEEAAATKKKAAKEAAAAKAAAEAKRKQEQAALAKLAEDDDADSGIRAKLEGDRINVTEKIQFEGGKAILKPGSFGILQEVAEVMLHYPSTRIEVGGHTADIGNDDKQNDYEMKLSRERAEAVVERLVTQGKIARDRLVAVGYGDTQPIATNSTREGKAQNRRVEFIVLKQPDAPKFASLQEAHIEVVEGIQFSKGKANVRPESSDLLDAVADIIKETPGLRIEVGAHCADVGDSDASDAIELKMTQDRAAAVEAELLARGVPAARLTAKGYGDTQPIEDNDTPEHRAANRRIEFRRL